MAQHRITLLYADTGGGHRASAQAIEKAIQTLYPGIYRTELVNAIHVFPYPFDQAEKAYASAISQARQGYELFWNVTNNVGSTMASRLFIETAGRAKARAFLERHPADVYVSCHPIASQLLPEALSRVSPNTPVVGVVTDLSTVHALCWSPKVNFYAVPTDEARRHALENGIQPSRITVTGQPIMPDFAERIAVARKIRALAPNPPGGLAVLLMGGGDGMGHLVDTARSLMQCGLELQLTVVCGRNDRARAEIKALRKNVSTRVLGFCDNVPELMGASDALVTKAGPGTICEGFIAGLPMVLYDAVPGQEAGNIDWVTDSGAGFWCPMPQQVLQQLRQWLAQPADLQRASQLSYAQARPDAALHIARLIADAVASCGVYAQPRINRAHMQLS